MSRIRSVFTTGAILVGSSVALLTGGIAKADPVVAPPVPAPAVPGMDMITQLAGNAPQLLQAASSMFSPKPAAVAAPLQTPPAAGLAPLAPLAAQTPLAPLALPMTGAPAVQPPVLGNSGDLPASAPGGIAIPNLTGLPVQLPPQLSVPGDLASLMPGAPGATAHPGAAAPVPTAAATSPMPGLGTLFPTSALP